MESNRRLAKAKNHCVATSLDAFGDGDLAFAAEQLNGPHFAQVHPNRVVRAIGDLGNLFGDVALLGAVYSLDLIVVVLRVVAIFPGLVIFNDIDAHLVERGHHVLDLLRGHLVLRQCLIQLIISDVAAFLRTR